MSIGFMQWQAACLSGSASWVLQRADSGGSPQVNPVQGTAPLGNAHKHIAPHFMQAEQGLLSCAEQNANDRSWLGLAMFSLF